MKYTELFESDFLTDETEIYKWMDESFINFHPNYLTIEADGLVYDGSLDLRTRYPENELNELKVQFKSVFGYFNLPNGNNITSLKGCPKNVEGYFNCRNTKINTLKECPISIGGDFYCNNIKITDPKEYRYALYCQIGGEFKSTYIKINEIINTYGGLDNRKYWAKAIAELSRMKI